MDESIISIRQYAQHEAYQISFCPDFVLFDVIVQVYDAGGTVLGSAQDVKFTPTKSS